MDIVGCYAKEFRYRLLILSLKRFIQTEQLHKLNENIFPYTTNISINIMPK